MLVLSRKKNESIVINNDITIVVVEIRGDKVRLGVEAPKEVPVHRREVYDAIKRNEAVQSGSTSLPADTNTAAPAEFESSIVGKPSVANLMLDARLGAQGHSWSPRAIFFIPPLGVEFKPAFRALMPARTPLDRLASRPLYRS